MPDVILMLHLEHENMRTVLDRLNRELIAIREGDEFDRNLIASVVEYVGSYQAPCHEPKEELVFRQLRSRHPSTAIMVDALLLEHAELRRAIRRLSDCVDQAFYGGEGGRQSLHDTGLAYLTLQDRHMQEEETALFPAALQRLTQQDWEEIEFAVFDAVDPLFSDTQERRFRALRSAILRDDHAVS